MECLTTILVVSHLWTYVTVCICSVSWRRYLWYVAILLSPILRLTVLLLTILLLAVGWLGVWILLSVWVGTTTAIANIYVSVNCLCMPLYPPDLLPNNNGRA